MHTTYIVGQENNSNISNGETYQQFPYEMSGMTIANFTRELNIPVSLDSGCSFHHAKNAINLHGILHKCKKMSSPDYMVILSCNGDLKVDFR